MPDPYRVLNIDPKASDEEVKRAYRELARKYHPDNYRDNPLSDLAQDKMKEINEAYDEIMRMRGAGPNGNGARSNGRSAAGTDYGSAGGEWTRIRTLIASGRLDEAEQLLNAANERPAEWFFLMGGICYRRGWMDEAARHFETACRMAPGNAEYAQALNMVRGGGVRPPAGYGNPVYRQAGGCSGCDVCTSLICADCCCECMGGDLIRCC